MAQPILCPNCKAPVEADPSKATVTCSYCGSQSKNTIFLPPPPAVPPRQPLTMPDLRVMDQAKRAQTWVKWIVLGTVLPTVLIPVVIAIVGTSATRSMVSATQGSRSRTRRSFSFRNGLGAAALEDEPEADSSWGEKLRVWGSCQSDVRRALDARRRYFMWVKDPERGPTCRERNVYGTYTLNDTSSCLKSLTQTRELSPRNADLENAGTEGGAALAALQPLLTQADRYYDQKDYQDDGCAKGRALHPQLMAAWKRLAPAAATMQRIAERDQLVLLRRRVQRLEQSGKSMRYETYRALLAALDFYAAAEKLDAEAENVERFKTLIATYSAALDQLDAAALRQRESASSIFWFSAYHDELQDLLKAAKKFTREDLASRERLARAGVPDDGEAEEPFSKVRAAYHDVVHAAGNLHFTHYKK